MRFYNVGDLRFNIPSRIFRGEPYLGYLLNGSLMIDGRMGPPAGSSVASSATHAMRKAISEMADRRALMRGGVDGGGRVHTWDLVQDHEDSLPVSFSSYRVDGGYPIDTTGTAGHPDSREAALRAVLELLEKNAMYLFWYGKWGERLDASAYERNAFAQLFTDSTLTLNVYINRSFAPVTAAFAIAHSDSGTVFMGSGADLSAREAIDHALQETFLLAWCRVINFGIPVSHCDFGRADDATLHYIRALAAIKPAASLDEVHARLHSPLHTVREALPSWVKSLHLVYLPQLAVPTVRCVKAFSYELYSHVLNPGIIDARRRINLETIRLTSRAIKAIPRCPMS